MATTTALAANLDSSLFLADPLPREVKYTIISVDDHVVEPPHTFEGKASVRSPRQGTAHRRDPGGSSSLGVRRQSLYAGRNERGSRPTRETVKLEPFRFEHMRPGCYDVEARAR